MSNENKIDKLDYLKQNDNENNNVNDEMYLPNLPESDNSESNLGTDNDVSDPIIEKMYSVIKTDENPTEGGDENATYVKNDINEWDVDDVISWLISLGNGAFKNYMDIFRKNAINGKDLQRLNDEYLEQMGVSRFFDRVDIMKEINKLLRDTDPYL